MNASSFRKQKTPLKRSVFCFRNDRILRAQWISALRCKIHLEIQTTVAFVKFISKKMTSATTNPKENRAPEQSSQEICSTNLIYIIGQVSPLELSGKTTFFFFGYLGHFPCISAPLSHAFSLLEQSGWSSTHRTVWQNDA